MQKYRFSNVNVMRLSCIILFTSLSGLSFSQIRNSDVYKFPEMVQTNSREIIRIPDIDGFVTLKCDFHTHTVFSDGQVSPMMRINEAWNDGLDAIAITDHIEYRPFKDIVNSDFNKSNEMALKYGKEIDFIVIPGAEITRKKPLGHLNALFVKDVNKLNIPDQVEAIKEAVKQGAFVMWNHPGWPNDSCTMYDIHKSLIKDKLIHGVEVFNSKEWYPTAMSWIKETGLTVMGNSDIHLTVRNVYGGERMARPMTLVFAKEKSVEGIKAALFDGRTLAVFYNHIAGKEDLLKKLVLKCLDVRLIDEQKEVIEISNKSDLEFTIKYGNNLEVLLPNKIKRVNLARNKEVVFTNCIIAENETLKMNLR